MFRRSILAATVIGASLVSLAVPSAARGLSHLGGTRTHIAETEAAPFFQLPFPCNETWYMSSYPSHPAYAIDFHATAYGSTQQGRTVVASHAGTIRVSDTGVDDPSGNSGGLGYSVVVTDGVYSTYYGHLRRGSASGLNGQSVSAGTKIGEIGSTGASTAAHLHFELRVNGARQPAVFNGQGVSYPLPGFSSGRAITSNNCPSATGGRMVAFQANTGSLYTYRIGGGGGNQSQGMKTGTSPSIAALAGGGYEMAFQANTGELIVFGDGGNVNTHLGMMPGTSPSIAASPSGGFKVAFQANTGSLYTYASNGNVADLQQGMKSGTSPSIAALAGGGYEIAFQANTGDLIVYGSGGNINTRQGMANGTSPAIAASGSSFRAVFQANTGNLYSFVPGAAANLGQGMKAGTSPSLA